jgi:hypothetical protein
MLIKPPERDGLCRGCKHFGVSYDRNFPYVCRAMGFKSRMLPIWEVKSADGRDCMSFQPRPKPPPSGRRG